jgi:branched-subunit amino acid aminotransferase/4-amino-4-deoxychorismate lyase
MTTAAGVTPEPVVFLNDRFVPASRAHLNIYDLGIVLGATLTEMTRTFSHKPFRLDDHLARLYRSCKFAGFHLPLSREAMHARTLELIEQNAKLLPAGEDLGIVHFVTPGENRIYAGSAAGSARLTPTICIHSFPLVFSAWRGLFTEGAHVVTPAIRHVPPECVDPKMKNRSRLHWWLADQQSHNVDPKAISLLLDLDGNITECGGSNFLVLRGKTICSPTSRNILEGVSMTTVRDLAPKLGLQWIEKDMQPYDVVNADEAWLTTTPYCLAPCTKINNIAIGDGQPGPGFKQMLAAWSGLVGVDILKQVMESKL